MKRSSTRPTLHVVLNTNSLFTEAADKLVNHATEELMLSAQADPDLPVKWYLPSVVKDERKYQMQKRAEQFLPHLARVERLLGHSFGIGRNLLDERVNSAIDHQMASLGIIELPLDVSKVDWATLINKATSRLAPFDSGEKEKGFRDALVLECFSQLLETLPRSRTLCRVLIVSGDQLLQEALRGKIADRDNARYFGDLDELQTYMAVLRSELTETLMGKLLPEARSLFFKPQDEKTFYYKEGIWRTLFAQHADTISSVPEADFTSTVTKVVVGQPSFIEKIGQRLRWSTKILVTVEAKKLERGPMSLSSDAGSIFLTSPGLLSSNPGLSLFQTPGTLTNTGLALRPPSAFLTENRGSPTYIAGGVADPRITSPSFREITREGTHVFEVIWEVTLTVRQTLINPKVVEIRHHETSWST
jgi:hypothetical protein